MEQPKQPINLSKFWANPQMVVSFMINYLKEKRIKYVAVTVTDYSQRGCSVTVKLLPKDPIQRAMQFYPEVVFKLVPSSIPELPNFNLAEKEINNNSTILRAQREAAAIDEQIFAFGKRYESLSSGELDELDSLTIGRNSMIGRLNVIGFPQWQISNDLGNAVIFLSDMMYKTLGVYLVTDLAAFNALGLDYRKMVALNVLKAIKYLSEIQYYHQDINPDTIVVPVRGTIKLIDHNVNELGWQNKLKFYGPYGLNYKPLDMLLSFDLGQNEQAGSPNWAKYAKKCDPEKTDTWAVGIILLEIIQASLKEPTGLKLQRSLVNLVDATGKNASEAQQSVVNSILQQLGRTKFSEMHNYPFYETTYASDYHERNIRGMGSNFTYIEEDELDLLDGLLQYKPKKRLSAREALSKDFLRVNKEYDTNDPLYLGKRQALADAKKLRERLRVLDEAKITEPIDLNSTVKTQTQSILRASNTIRSFVTRNMRQTEAGRKRIEESSESESNSGSDIETVEIRKTIAQVSESESEEEGEDEGGEEEGEEEGGKEEGEEEGSESDNE